MKVKAAAKRTTTAVAVAVIAIGGATLALERATGPAFPNWVGTAYAQEHGGGPGGSGGESGGHTGGESGGSAGHGSGGGHGGGGSGMGGGHEAGGETGGEESKGHGTRYQHQGHASGEHGHSSSHQAGGDHFGGGSGLRGNDQIPEGIGRYGAGYSTLEASEQGRFRYWGGWYVPEEPVVVNPTGVSSTDAAGTSSEMIPGPGGGPAVNVRATLDESARCEGVTSGMSAARQFSGANLLRLNTARGLVDPVLAASGKVGSPYLMANLQSELTKPQPNTELAGTYLGLLAKVPVSLDTVKKIGFQLCAVVGDAQAKEIAQVAEQQRAALSAASGAMGGADHGKPQ